MSEIHSRLINTAIWRDDWFLGLRESEQHLFMYLLTCPATTISGVYQLGLMEAAFHTKIDAQEIKRIFAERFEPDKKAFFNVGYVIIPNFLKHQQFNPNQWKAVQNNVNHLPEWLRTDILNPTETLYIPFETLSDGWLTVGVNKKLIEYKLSKVKVIEVKATENNPQTVDKSIKLGKSPNVSELEKTKRRLAESKDF